jgi:hypothetical protein
MAARFSVNVHDVVNVVRKVTNYPATADHEAFQCTEFRAIDIDGNCTVFSCFMARGSESRRGMKAPRAKASPALYDFRLDLGDYRPQHDHEAVLRGAFLSDSMGGSRYTSVGWTLMRDLFRDGAVYNVRWDDFEDKARKLSEAIPSMEFWVKRTLHDSNEGSTMFHLIGGDMTREEE